MVTASRGGFSMAMRPEVLLPKLSVLIESGVVQAQVDRGNGMTPRLLCIIAP